LNSHNANKNNKIKLLIFAFLVAVVASIASIARGDITGIKTALVQGTNETSSSSSGMNMTGTQSSGGEEVQVILQLKGIALQYF
jgi:hypothetical protein